MFFGSSGTYRAMRSSSFNETNDNRGKDTIIDMSTRQQYVAKKRESLKQHTSFLASQSSASKRKKKIIKKSKAGSPTKNRPGAGKSPARRKGSRGDGSKETQFGYSLGADLPRGKDSVIDDETRVLYKGKRIHREGHETESPETSPAAVAESINDDHDALASTFLSENPSHTLLSPIGNHAETISNTLLSRAERRKVVRRWRRDKNRQAKNQAQSFSQKAGLTFSAPPFKRSWLSSDWWLRAKPGVGSPSVYLKKKKMVKARSTSSLGKGKNKGKTLGVYRPQSATGRSKKNTRNKQLKAHIASNTTTRLRARQEMRRNRPSSAPHRQYPLSSDNKGPIRMHEEISSTNEDNGIADDTEDIVRRAIVTTFSTTADTLEKDIDSGNNEGLQRSERFYRNKVLTLLSTEERAAYTRFVHILSALESDDLRMALLKTAMYDASNISLLRKLN